MLKTKFKLGRDLPAIVWVLSLLLMLSVACGDDDSSTVDSGSDATDSGSEIDTDVGIDTGRPGSSCGAEFYDCIAGRCCDDIVNGVYDSDECIKECSEGYSPTCEPASDCP